MTRAQLPNRRAADKVTFTHDKRRWTATFGRFADGKLAEIFLDTEKESAVADAARESAILTSLALQHGCDIETIRHALDGRDVGPIGAALALVDGDGLPDVPLQPDIGPPLPPALPPAAGEALLGADEIHAAS